MYDYSLSTVDLIFILFCFFFFFQAEDGIRDLTVTGVQTCALPISSASGGRAVSGCLDPGGRRTPHDVACHRGGAEERLPPHFCRGAARERRYGHSRRAVHDRDDHQDQPDPARPRRRAAAAARRAQGYGPPLYG